MMGHSPDIVRPDQYFTSLAPYAAEPEKKLMLAVLEEAVVDATWGSKTWGRNGRVSSPAAAIEWLESTDSDWPMSFENICECLALDADYIRGGVLALVNDSTRERTLPSLTPVVALISDARKKAVEALYAPS